MPVLLDTLRNTILPQVQKPGQYIGNEWGARYKDWDSAKSHMAIIYPDLYEIGMSNFGIKILYNIVNDHDDYLCDRAYAVMPDMEALMKQHELPLWGWETGKPLKEFDFIGFSLAYELCYTNVLSVMDLAGIPLLSKDRSDSDPLIFAGGPAVFNPEPMADYIDFYIVGDGEELILEVQELLMTHRTRHCEERSDEAISTQGLSRKEFLYKLSQLQGIYVPQLYEPDLNENYLPKPIEDRLLRRSFAAPLNDEIPFPVRKRVTQYLTDINQPVSGPVPHLTTVQDKQVLEIRRGCDRGCRFCQVGYTYLPVRERSSEDLLRLSNESARNSGYEDFSLLSLSASDYTCLTEAARAINDTHSENGVGLSMPSQRADRFNVHLAAEVTGARKSGMTFAPEAGTERMRRIINKGLSDAEIKNAIRGSYEQGWKQIKLYFMIGLPFEEDADLDGILDILEWALRSFRGLNINCTLSTFVPKTFTAFQWFPQCSVDEFRRKERYVIEGLRARRIARQVKLNYTEPELAQIEAVLSRGDRRWGQVIRKIWESGSRFDSWSENFKIERWQQAASDCGLDLADEASRYREPGSKQCWDVLSIGFTDKFLLHEWQQAVKELETAPCTENKCHACGVCFNLNVKNIVVNDLSEGNPFVERLSDEILTSPALQAPQDDETEVIKQEWLIKAQKYRELIEFIDEILTSLTSFAPQDDVNGDGIATSSHLATPRNDECDDETSTPRNDRAKPEPTVIVRNTHSAQKLRLRITKLGDMRFISHLDFARLFERALRRTGLPVVHSTGFNQRMKISWGAALPLFVESEGEYIEIDLSEAYPDLDNLKQILNQELPVQVRIVEVRGVSSGEKVSISDVVETVYTAKLIVSEAFSGILEESIKSFLAEGEIWIKHLSKGKEKSKNIRDQIIDMKLLDSSKLELRLRSTQRVDQVLSAFMPDALWQVCKTETILRQADTALMV